MKQRTGDPWKPADFQTAVLGAKVHYADPDFAALNVGGVELMLHADDTYDTHPWYTPLVEDPDGYLWAVGVPTPPKPGS
jgi:hypothetical protein